MSFGSADNERFDNALVALVKGKYDAVVVAPIERLSRPEIGGTGIRESRRYGVEKRDGAQFIASDSMAYVEG